MPAPSARARSRHARTAPGQHATHRKNRCARTVAASAAATGPQHAHARRTAQRTHRARPPYAAASSRAADTRHHARTTARRRTTTKRCRVPKRTQRRRRRSMGHGGTGPPPRQRGGRLVPLMRAWLTPPHDCRHKSPPQPCALTATSSWAGTWHMLNFAKLTGSGVLSQQRRCRGGCHRSDSRPWRAKRTAR